MAEIKINNVNGNNNVFGDNNTITNSLGSNSPQVLVRDEYYKMMLEILELERISVGDYIEEKYRLHISKNPDFVKILYKDIYHVLDGVDHEGDNDLIIENGDFAFEYGDFKVSGRPTNLHYTMTWLHMKLVTQFMQSDFANWQRKLHNFESDFLKINYNTQEYNKKISALNSRLKKERNLEDTPTKKNFFNFLNNVVDLKPNVAGIGINFNELLRRILGK